jgi:hypothetical protein
MVKKLRAIKKFEGSKGMPKGEYLVCQELEMTETGKTHTVWNSVAKVSAGLADEQEFYLILNLKAIKARIDRKVKALWA